PAVTPPSDVSVLDTGAVAGDATGRTLPATGAESTLLALAGVALLAVGGAAEGFAQAGTRRQRA
ncbi:MAG: LPXTG cell wall anchor domain-containing protein, partial [Actinomycetota bacterium]